MIYTFEDFALILDFILGACFIISIALMTVSIIEWSNQREEKKAEMEYLNYKPKEEY